MKSLIEEATEILTEAKKKPYRKAKGFTDNATPGHKVVSDATEKRGVFYYSYAWRPEENFELLASTRHGVKPVFILLYIDSEKWEFLNTKQYAEKPFKSGNTYKELKAACEKIVGPTEPIIDLGH